MKEHYQVNEKTAHRMEENIYKSYTCVQCKTNNPIIKMGTGQSRHFFKEYLHMANKYMRSQHYLSFEKCKSKPQDTISDPQKWLQ